MRGVKVWRTLAYGASITVDGNSYEVRENRLIEDGAFCLATLTRLDNLDGTAITTLNSMLLITLDGRYLVTL
jgi:hypothetical protein